MNKQEVNNLLALLKANYSYAFKTMSTQEKYLMLNSWTFALQDLSADVVLLAVMKLLTVSKWIPTVAEIREKVQSMYYEALELMPNAIELEYLDEAKQQRQTAIANGILEKTNHLRGDSAPELTLREIVNNPQYAQLMAGNRAVLGMTGQTFRIEDGQEEEEP